MRWRNLNTPSHIFLCLRMYIYKNKERKVSKFKKELLHLPLHFEKHITTFKLILKNYGR